MMDRKKLLTFCVVALMCVGVVFAIAPLLKSLGPNAKADNNATYRIDISSMSVGDVKSIDGFYYLYRQDQDSYLLMNGWAPRRSCAIALIEAGQHDYRWGERKAYSNQRHFAEPCDGGIWELTGEHVPGTGHPEEKDMEQRYFRLVGKSHILFHHGRD